MPELAAQPADSGRPQTNALAQAADWRSRAASGQSGTVFRECFSTLMKQPRSWFALQAQRVLDDLMTNYPAFHPLDISNLAQTDFASDLLYYYARGAATNRDWQRYECALRALTGVAFTSGDRAGDTYYLLTNFLCPKPLLQLQVSRAAGQVNLSIAKDAPGLSYSVESRTNLLADAWTSLPTLILDYDTTWTATTGLAPEEKSRFYRAKATPIPAVSLPWPDNGGYGQ